MRKISAQRVIGTLVLLLFAALVLLPLFWLGVSAFKSDADVIKWPPIFFPTEWVTTPFAYDGMGEWKIYLKIILPLAKPALVTLGIYHFMNNWNDLLYPMMLTSSVEMRTLSAGLAILVGSNSIKYGPTLAATVIAILPLLLLFLFGQKFFMEGIATSGMKE